jgi:hypothetical protein
MKKIIFALIITSLFLFSFVSATVGISSQKVYTQEKGTVKTYQLALFNDKATKGKLEVISGSSCVKVKTPEVVFDKGAAYGQFEINTLDKDCRKGLDEVKLMLSPLDSELESGTVGINMAVIKSFSITVPSISTIAILVISVLILAVLLLIAAMVKIAKRK